MGLILRSVLGISLLGGLYYLDEYVRPGLDPKKVAAAKDEARKFGQWSKKIGAQAGRALKDGAVYLGGEAKEVIKDGASIAKKELSEAARQMDSSLRVSVFRDKKTGDWMAVKSQAMLEHPVVITQRGYQVRAIDVTGKLVNKTFEIVDNPQFRTSFVIGDRDKGIVIPNPSKIPAATAPYCGDGVSPNLDCEALNAFLARAMKPNTAEISVPGALNR
jgi:hypothetical protein